MMWEYCRFCTLTGYCENQDMGRECNSGVKKLYEENQQLKGILKECRDDVYNNQYVCLDTLTKIDNALGEK